MSVISIENAGHYGWGDQCEGWHLLQEADLHIILEKVPPGRAERRHRHGKARQFFFILSGRAVMELDGREYPLLPGQGLPVPPGLSHQFRNPYDEPVEFLVISHPTTRGDRADED